MSEAFDSDLVGSVEKYLVLSTAHILQSDADLLNEHVAAGEDDYGRMPLVLPDREYGWKIPLSEGVAEDFQKLGVSPSFMKCIEATRLVGCTWLHLDRDGNDLGEHPLLDSHLW